MGGDRRGSHTFKLRGFSSEKALRVSQNVIIESRDRLRNVFQFIPFFPQPEYTVLADTENVIAYYLSERHFR